jgi:hypothetical protein
VAPGTVIIDAEGAPQSVDDIADGETLYAYIAPLLALSMPPQATAELIIRALPADATAPAYAEVTGISFSADGKSATAVMNNDVNLHLSADISYFPYLTRNIVTLDQIRPGSRLVAWYSFVATSFPAQATPTKVLVLPYDYTGYAALSLQEIALNGHSLQLAASEQPYVKDAHLMLPLRKWAEALGATVDWDAANFAITVKQAGVTLYSLPNVASVAQTPDSARELAVSTDLTAGVTFIAADDLLALHKVYLQAE